MPKRQRRMFHQKWSDLISALETAAQTNQPPELADEASSPSVRFRAARIPPVAIRDYGARILQYGEIDEAAITPLVHCYLERFLSHVTFRELHALNIHRLMLTATLVATKFYQDEFYNNQHWARIGGISMKELNKLERYFLRTIKWNLSVPPHHCNSSL